MDAGYPRNLERFARCFTLLRSGGFPVPLSPTSNRPASPVNGPRAKTHRQQQTRNPAIPRPLVYFAVPPSGRQSARHRAIAPRPTAASRPARATNLNRHPPSVSHASHILTARRIPKFYTILSAKFQPVDINNNSDRSDKILKSIPFDPSATQHQARRPANPQPRRHIQSQPHTTEHRSCSLIPA